MGWSIFLVRFYTIPLAEWGSTYAKRIYKIIFVIFIVSGIFSLNANGQEVGAFRTITSGNFDQISIWEVYDGSNWNPASMAPDNTSDVYVAFGHEVTLTQNQSVKSLYLNAQTGTGKKLDINGNELSLYGSLNAFSGAVPGIPSGTWNNIDWIGSSLESKLVFKGASRIAIPEGAWSALSTRSRYTMVFAPEPDAILTVQESVKASEIIIESGTVIQEGIPGVDCATFSFNTNPAITGAYGSLTIAENAALESYCNAPIVQRSSTQPAQEMTLADGGTLVLHAPMPELHAANVNLLGEVHYAAPSGIQELLKNTLTGTAEPSYHDLYFEGESLKNLPPTLFLSGDMIRNGTGPIQGNNTALSIIGAEDQSISGMALSIEDLEVDKPMGTVSFDDDLTILRHMTMKAGAMDFGGHDMTLNQSGLGSYEYEVGQWHNLEALHYKHPPNNLNISNASFPFVDTYEGGTRLLQLLGPNPNAGNNLTIRYTQLPGVDHDADFFDTDGTWILYQLYSYFSFSGFTGGNNFITLRISGQGLIIDEVDDLRIVADHEPAAGNHRIGIDQNGWPWARRKVRLNQLSNHKFTIGSERVATILPVTWLSYGAKAVDHYNVLHWEITDERQIKGYKVYRSAFNVDNFEPIGEIEAKGSAGEDLPYQFVDENPPLFGHCYYKITSLSSMGNEEPTPIFLVKRTAETSPSPRISPNPYNHGDLGSVQFCHGAGMGV